MKIEIKVVVLLLQLVSRATPVFSYVIAVLLSNIDIGLLNLTKINRIGEIRTHCTVFVGQHQQQRHQLQQQQQQKKQLLA